MSYHDTLERLRRQFPNAPKFYPLICARYVELTWWDRSFGLSMGYTGQYVFLMAGRLELYVGRL